MQQPFIASTHRVEVRPVGHDERQRWQDLMARFHDLGWKAPVGENLQHVAIVDGCWVAIIAWAAAALSIAAREAWVGWSPLTKRHKLKLVANNTRFLLLALHPQKNLASHVLALSARRLSADWAERYGHPLLMAETFVDGSRRGTCYRAAGWIRAGETKGFSRTTGGTYRYHGQPKMIWLLPLARNARRCLATPPVYSTPDGRRYRILDHKRLPLNGENGLIAMMRSVIDPRRQQGKRHSLIGVLTTATCAMLAGAQGFRAIAEWAQGLTPKQLLALRNRRGKAPSLATYWRVLTGLDAQAFDAAITRWLQWHKISPGDGISIDGKVLRGSGSANTNAVQLLSALLQQERIVLAQQRIADKSNEIPAVKPLLQHLQIEGAVITADAMHTQKDTADFIVNMKKADFVFTVKGNQPTLHEALQSLDYEAFSPTTHIF